MPDRDENEAHATDRIVDAETGETVGFLYAWEDGPMQPFWLDGARSNVTIIVLNERTSRTRST